MRGAPHHASTPKQAATNQPSEHRLALLARLPGDVLCLLDADGKLTYVSGAVERTFGYTPEQFAALISIDMVHLDDRELIRTTWNDLLREPGREHRIELRIADATGNWRWVEAIATNHLDDPELRAVVFNYRDITEAHQTQEALRASEARFRIVVQNSYDVTAVIDRAGTVKWVTPNVVGMFGYHPEEVVGTSGFDYVHPDDHDLMVSELMAFVAGEDVPTPMTIRMRHKNGSWRYIKIIGTSFLDHPDIDGIAVNLRAIDDRVRAERDRQRLLDIFELTDDVVGITTADGIVVYLNRAARELLGTSDTDELARFDLAERFSADSLDRLGEEMVESLRSSGRWRGEIEVIDRDGRTVPMIAQLLAHHDDQGEIEFFSGILHDISRRKQLEQRLAFEATHDPLTGLPNRTLLLDRLRQALARSQRDRSSVALLFCDLDHFKEVNDALGHSRGDEVPVDIARRLERELRPSDTIARFGGDEFVVVCESIAGPDEAASIANRLVAELEGVAPAASADGGGPPVGVSIGVAICSDSRAEPETLLREADAAMYRAKSRGRGRIEFAGSVHGPSRSA